MACAHRTEGVGQRDWLHKRGTVHLKWVQVYMHQRASGTEGWDDGLIKKGPRRSVWRMHQTDEALAKGIVIWPARQVDIFG